MRDGLSVFIIFCCFCGLAVAAAGIDAAIWGLPFKHHGMTLTIPSPAPPLIQEAEANPMPTPTPVDPPKPETGDISKDLEAWWAFRQTALSQMDAWWNARKRADRPHAKPTRRAPGTVDISAAEKSWGSPGSSQTEAAYEQPRYLDDASRWPLNGAAAAKQ